MRKRRLDVDALVVDSFALDGAEAAGGTVRAHDQDADDSRNETFCEVRTCGKVCHYTLPGTCVRTCATCGEDPCLSGWGLICDGDGGRLPAFDAR